MMNGSHPLCPELIACTRQHSQHIRFAFATAVSRKLHKGTGILLMRRLRSCSWAPLFPHLTRLQHGQATHES